MVIASGSPVLIRGYRLALSIEGLSSKTVDAYIREVERLDHFGQGRGLTTLTATDLREYFLARSEYVAPKTVHEAQLAIRRFYKFLVQEGEVTHDRSRDVRLVRYRVDPQPTYSEAEVKRLLMVCGQRTHEDIRDRAMVLVLFDTGVRAGELVSMGLPDWERRQVQVRGKTGVRTVPLGTAALQAVERYVRRWGIGEAPLWRGKKGGLTGSGVLQAVRRLCRQAGVEDKGVHAFRRAAAAQMKALGMQDSDILEVLGWKDLTMLRRYTAAVATELAKGAHKRFSPADHV